MFFKAVGLVLWISLLSACGLKIGDQPPVMETGRFANSNLGCLDGVEEKFKQYWDGSLAEEELRKTAACVRGALNLFEDKGRGQRTDGFEPSELAGFLNRRFLGQSKISEEFLAALMRVKLVIVGGSERFVTKEEFRRLLEMVDFIEDEALKNRKFISIYKLASADVTSKKVDAAKAQLIRTAYSLAELFRESTIKYTVEDIRKLIREFRIFLRVKKSEGSLSFEDLWAERAKVYLQVALGQSEEHIAPKDWVGFTATLAGWYGLYLDYHYKLREENIRLGAGLRDLIRMVTDGFSLVETAINVQKGSVITFATIDSLLFELHRAEVLPKTLRLEESLKPTVRYVFGQIFRSLDQPLNAVATDGLNLVSLGEIKKEFLIWAETQKDIDRKYDREMPAENAEITCLGGKESFRCLMNLIRPFYLEGSNMVWIGSPKFPDYSRLKHHFDSLSRLNVIRAFSRVLIRGWAEDVDRASLMKGITEIEAVKFYETAKELGADLKLMDPRKNTVGDRIFKEANLFTFSGNGIQAPVPGSDAHLLTLQESIEQLAIVTSSGQTSSQIYDDVLEICRKDEEKRQRRLGLIRGNEEFQFSVRDEIYDHQMVPRACAHDKLGSVTSKYLENLPALRKAVKVMPQPKRQEFFSSLLDLAKGECQKEDWVEYSEFSTVGALLHYSEIVFNRYDVNYDDLIDAREAMKSYLKFRIFLRTEAQKITGKTLPEGQLKGVFAFLLSKGRLPDGIADSAKILAWDAMYFDDDPLQFTKDDFKAPDFTIDRNGLINVLKVLNQPSDPADVDCQALQKRFGQSAS